VIEAAGHRSGIRAVAVSSDDATLLSAAAGAVKLWNARTSACLRTIETGQVTPLSRHSLACRLACRSVARGMDVMLPARVTALGFY
jgi:WD40 repeat protein